MALTVAAILDVQHSRRQLLQKIRTQAESTGFLMSEWISVAFKEVDRLAMAMVTKVEGLDWDTIRYDPATHERVYEFLWQQRESFPHAVELGYIDSQCKVVAALFTEAGHDFSDREYCSFVREPSGDSSHVSRLIFGNLDRFEIVYFRKVRKGHGNAVGSAAIGLDLSFFQQWLDRTKSQEMDLLSITDLEGHLLAQSPGITQRLGQVVPDQTLIKLLGADVNKAHYEVVSPFNGRSRFIHFVRVPELPFVAVVVTDQEVALASLHEKIVAYTTALILIWGLVAIAVGRHFHTLNQAVKLQDMALSERLKQEEQGRFLAMLGHELKTPLSVIRFALSGKTLTPERRQAAVRSINDMGDIIDTSQHAGRMESGEVSPLIEDCDLGLLLDEITHAPEISDRILVSICRLSTIQSDCSLVRIIVSNLIGNAIKYGDPDKPVTIDLLETEDGKGVELVVANAPGVAGWPDEKKLFEKYYRSQKARSVSGSGLGLYLVDGFCSMIGGRLIYQPTAEQVRFRLYLPKISGSPSTMSHGDCSG